MRYNKVKLLKDLKHQSNGFWYTSTHFHVYLMTNYYILRFDIDEWHEIWEYGLKKLKPDDNRMKSIKCDSMFKDLIDSAEYRLKDTRLLVDCGMYVRFFFNSQAISKPAIVGIQQEYLELLGKNVPWIVYGSTFKNPVCIADETQDIYAVFLPVRSQDNVYQMIDSYMRSE